MSKIKVKSNYKICTVTTISNTMEWFVTPSMRYLNSNGFDISLMCDMDESFVKKNSDYANCYPIPMNRGMVNVIEAIIIVWRMYRIFSREKFDIVQYTSPNASFYASIAAWLARVPKRLYNQWGLRYVSLNGNKRKIFRFIEKLTCSLSSHVRSPSKLNLEFAIADKLCSANKVSVVGIGGTIGIDLKEYNLSFKNLYKDEVRRKYKISDKSFVFGYVGRINNDKGINELIEAFKDISLVETESMLMLVGMIDESNPIEDRLLQWARGSNRVLFTGNVQSEDVCKYLSAFNVLVHPTYREGFGKVLQEAMGMQIPIITTNVPGPSEVVEDGVSGLLVPARDWYSLKMKMIELKREPTKMLNLSIEGRKRAEKYFDRRVMLKHILEDIYDILEK